MGRSGLVVIAVTAAFVLASCGQDTDDGPSDQTATPVQTPDSTDVAPDHADGTPTRLTDDDGLLITPEDLAGETAEDTIEIVIWEDMGCPACRAFALSHGDYLASIVADGQATIEYRFANFLDRNSPNDYSTRAAAATVCVYEEDGPEAFKAFQLAAYAAQPQGGTAGPEDDALADLARQAGASDTATECIEAGRFEPWVRDAARAFGSTGVNWTPGIVINGDVHEGEATEADIQAALDAIRGDGTAGGDDEAA